MSERKLVSRKRKPPKGKPIKVSAVVYNTLDLMRRGRSFDCTLRRMLGMPDKEGKEQPLIEGMLDVTSGLFMLKMPQASWPELEETAYKLADVFAKQNRKRLQAPIKMRELR